VTKQEATSNHGGIQITRDDLLKYVELDLWSRFSVRLWGALAAFLTLIAVAGFLGVPYYIRSEMDQRLREQEAAFAHRTAEAITYSELLIMAVVRYHEARFEVEKDMAMLLGTLQSYRSSLPSNDTNVRPLDFVLQDLTQARSLTDYTAAVDSLEAHISANLAKQKLDFAGSITQSVRTVQGVAPITTSHPVQNGTLLGAVRDIRFQLLELEAYRRALADVESDLSTLGAVSPLERRQSRATLVALQHEAFSSRYAAHRAQLSKEFLTGESLQAWASSNDIYLLAAELSASEAHQ